MRKNMKKKSVKSFVLVALAIVFTVFMAAGIYIHAIDCDTTPCGGTWYYCTWKECGAHPEIYMCCIIQVPEQ